MKGRILLLGLLLLSVIFMGACSGSSPMSTTPLPTGGSSLVSLTMGDAPPTGVSVLCFEITVTGATLNSSSGSVSLLSHPAKVEVERLQVESAFLSTSGVPADTYNSITVTFANPEMTIKNTSGSAIGSCANGAVCELTPGLGTASVTYSDAPFPLTLAAGSQGGLQLDFNLNSSIQTDLSIQPTITFQQLTAAPGSGELEDGENSEGEDFSGKVTAKDTANNQFTLQKRMSDQTVTIKVDNNTVFEDFTESGGQNSFASLAVGQVVSVKAQLMPNGDLIAKKVELHERENERGLEGTITSVDSATQFKMVTTDESPDISDAQVGNVVTVTIQNGASFGVGRDGMTIPSGLSFSSSADLLVGQAVRVHRLAVSSGTSITTDRIRLAMSRFTAKVMSVDAPNLNFIVNNLPGLFTSATPPITQIQVRTSDRTRFEGTTSLATLSVNDTVSLRGLLFKTTGAPALLASKVRKRGTM